MNLKTPLFLILIVGTLYVAAFLIWPAFEKIGPKKENLRISQELVESIRQKNANMSALIASLKDGRNASQRDFVFDFIPMTKKEEKIFNSLNAIANSDDVKVALGNISLAAEKNEMAAAKPEPQSSQEVVFGNKGEAAATKPAVSVLSKEKTLKTTVLVLGKYENIKKFIEKIYTLDMLKSISSINLVSAQNEAGGATENISADLVAEFSYIPGAKINKDYNNPIFGRNQFNFASVDQIKGLLLERAGAVTVMVGSEGVGRSNPFLP